MDELQSTRHVPAVSLRDPGLWVILLMLAVGGQRIAAIMLSFAAAYPWSTLTAVALFGLLLVPFWLLIAGLDFLVGRSAVPNLLAFAWGALVATAISIPGSSAAENILAALGSPHLAADWGAALAGPSVEEAAKTLGVIAVIMTARRQVDSILDGIVLGALVGLGFQLVEDVVFAVGAVALAGQGDQIQPVLTTFLLRGVLSGLWSHTLFSALAGAGIGYLVVRRDRSFALRAGTALLAVVGSWAAHVLWNSPLFIDGLGNGSLGLLGVTVLKVLPPLLLVYWLVRWAHDREADYYVSRLSALQDPELVTPGELLVLGSGSRRAAARRHAAAQGGRAAQRAVRRLQRTQARLAVELCRAPGEVSYRSAQVRQARMALQQAGHAEAIAGPRSWRHTVGTALTIAAAVVALWAALAAVGAT